MSDEAMVHLWEYDWPGNVRELENLLERLVDPRRRARHRASTISRPPSARSSPSADRHASSLGDAGLDLNTAVEEFEHRLIAEALRRTKGNKQAAARLLGVKRTTLVAKLRRRAEGTPCDIPHEARPAAVGPLGAGIGLSVCDQSEF